MDGEYQATRTLETRPLRRMDGEYQATGTLETRPLITQNQQLAGEETASIDRSEVLVNLVGFRSIEQIALCKTLAPEQRSDALELSNAIRTYQREYGPKRRDLGPPDEEIIARCLAVASLSSLLSELKQMRMRAVRAGDGYIWYLYVFCQRLKGIPTKVLGAGLKACARHQHQRPQRSLDFTTQLSGDVTQRMRRIS